MEKPVENISNNIKLKELEILYSEIKKYKEIYSLLKTSSSSNSQDDKELILTRKKILGLLFRLRKLIDNFEASETPD